MIEKMTAFQGRMMAMVMAIATILFFGLGGAALITYVQERSLPAVFTVQSNIAEQLGAGLLGGTLIGVLAMFIVSRSYMRSVSKKYARLIGELKTTRGDRIMIALCAGVGEEIFFRGAVQYWLGIPLTAVVFVAIHGYLDWRDIKILLYGIFMTFVMIGFGIVAEQYGLWAPIVAHMMIDVVLLEYLQVRSTRLPPNEQENQGANPEL